MSEALPRQCCGQEVSVKEELVSDGEACDDSEGLFSGAGAPVANMEDTEDSFFEVPIINYTLDTFDSHLSPFKYLGADKKSSERKTKLNKLKGTREEEELSSTNNDGSGDVKSPRNSKGIKSKVAKVKIKNSASTGPRCDKQEIPPTMLDGPTKLSRQQVLTTIQTDSRDIASLNAQLSYISRISLQGNSSSDTKHSSTSGKSAAPKTKKKCKEVFACSECDKTYTTIYNLRHHKTVHTGQEPFQCNVCFKKFTQRKHYNKHMAIHLRIMNFECKICSKRFLFSGQLKTHLHSHSDEKKYQCELCLKRFTLSSNLKAHKNRHATTEKQYRCELCLKTFSRPYHLQDHILLHGDRPFKCDVCDRTFTTEYHMTKHRLYHTRERNLQCSMCVRKFGRKGDLVRHQQTHSGVKPFSCHLCTKRFSLLFSLQRHLLIHQGKSLPVVPVELQIQVNHRKDLLPGPNTCTDEEICQRDFLSKEDLNIKKEVFVQGEHCHLDESEKPEASGPLNSDTGMPVDPWHIKRQKNSVED